ncbi:DUF5794 domain-containing protein [Halopiger aswanensis]|uniref:Uncharacterized protein n=1 Tax=Halopiger aswanensis TaxID=148449 RepID=A0A419WHS0_9EURY|nr:DUF5794 domain-containing protein [Halopiger aswanensis]RKD95038.1 hypothetical protein ATJ93_1887 [Halopiger aswanensis]
MSTSQHPVALRLERLVGGDARLLAVVMMLPLIDGVFPALILAGALNDPVNAVQVGLLIFGGSATVAVILAEMDGTAREQAAIVLLVGIPLILLAAAQAVLAPAIGSMLEDAIITRFAALVILAIAAQTASATIGDYLPNPAVIIGLGLVASVDLTDVSFTLMTDPELVAHAALAAGVGVGFALSVALGGPFLREYMDIDRFRFGSAVALGLLPLSLLGMAFGQAPLAALLVAGLFALDLPLERGSDADADADADVEPESPPTPAVGTGPLTDGGAADSSEEAEPSPTTVEPDSDPEDAYPSDEARDADERAPWL